jgi:hypothetical protein
MNIVNYTHFIFPRSLGVVKALEFYNFMVYHFGTQNPLLVIFRDRHKTI